MINAVLYARYSSDMQREESITAQLRAGRDYCNKKKYNIVKEYYDEAYSGTNDNRPSFQEMLTDAKNGLFEIVVFHKVDRNSRNEYYYYFNKMRLTKYGVKLEYSAQSIDSTPEGILMESMLVGFAAYYSRNLAKEVRKGMKENIYKGYFNGGVAPLGYKIIDKKYVVDEYEAKAVRIIFDLYLKGNGYIGIVKKLNDAGYKTRTGRQFSKHTLYELLNNPKYIGRYIFGRAKNTTPSGKRNNHAPLDEDAIIVDGVIPPIIEKEIFEKVAKKMQANKRQAGKYSAKHTYLLSGIIRCGVCGSAMQGTTTRNSSGNLFHYYRCGKKYSSGTQVCNNKNINLVELENLIIEKIETNIFNSSNMDKLVEKLSLAYAKRMKSSRNEKTTLFNQKEKAVKRMNNLYSIVEDGLADEFDKQRLMEVKQEILKIEKELSDIENHSAPYLNREQIKGLF